MITLKIQCVCGQRYAFDVEPVRSRMPGAVACPVCGADGTAQANVALESTLDPGAAPVPPPAPEPVAPGPSKARLSLSGTRETASAPTPPSSPGEAAELPAETRCLRHPAEIAQSACVVCSKPICLLCLQSFGYLCSVQCRYEGERRGIAIPKCERQNSVVNNRTWQRVGRITAGIGVGIVALVGFSGYYHFSLSRPKVFFSYAPSMRPISSHLLGPDQVLILQKDKLVLQQISSRRELWAQPMESHVRPEPTIDPQMKQMRDAAQARMSPEQREEMAQAWWDAPKVEITPRAIWLLFDDHLQCLDRQSGTPRQRVALPGAVQEFHVLGEDLTVIASGNDGKNTVLRLAVDGSTEPRREEVVLRKPEARPLRAGEKKSTLEPNAANLVQEELAADDPEWKESLRAQLVPAGDHLVEMQTRLVEANMTVINAMKPKSTKTQLDGNVRAGGNLAGIAEEVFNDIKRAQGGGNITIDNSRYEVELRPLNGSVPWKGEVVGPPTFIPLTTVDLLTAGTGLILLDKSSKKITETKLKFRANAISGAMKAGQGPAVEHNGMVYFFDQGFLTALELPGGGVRWRLPSIGISQVQPDGLGNLYVTSTSASVENLEFSEQIQIAESVKPVLLKVREKSGKIVWKSREAGDACHLSGKYLYVTRTQSGGLVSLIKAGESDEDASEHFRVYRLDPDNGRTLWEYYHKGAPRDVDFAGNRILLAYKKEVQVLKFWSF